MFRRAFRTAARILAPLVNSRGSSPVFMTAPADTVPLRPFERSDHCRGALDQAAALLRQGRESLRTPFARFAHGRERIQGGEADGVQVRPRRAERAHSAKT